MSRILSVLGKIPGALMIVPLFLGAIINTFFPQVLEIGSFTTALFRDGALALIGAFFVCMGAQISVRAAGPAVEKGFAIMLGKLLAGVAVGLGVATLLPGGLLLGLTPLAIIAAMTNSNGALFVALTQEFGNDTDKGAVSVISINDGPFFTLIVLGAAGLAEFPLITLVAVLIPIVLGFILGNLDDSIRDFLRTGEQLLIPFMAVAVGTGINFFDLLQAGPPGILLGIMTVVISGFGAMALLYLVQLIHRRRRQRRNVIAGACEATTGGNAIATPLAVATADPSFRAIEATATAQVAASVVTTAILVPFFVILIHRWQTSRGVYPANEFEAITDADVSGLSPSGPVNPDK